MSDFYVERPSDAALVQNFAGGFAAETGASRLYPDNTWYLLLHCCQGQTRLAVGGPVTQSWLLPHAAETEWLGVRFSLGAFLLPFPVRELLNGLIYLPAATRHSFWLQGAAWEYPTLENADTFVRRLLRAEVLVSDPAIAAVLSGQAPALSAGTLRRRFARATGLRPGTARQVERVRHAARLLKQGVSILDTVQAAGYFDQPHLTRAMRYFLGQTPTQIARQFAPA